MRTSRDRFTLKPKFSGHQTFAFRHGWLEKGYAHTKASKSFKSESAIVDLGVGKNMVESIKYWCEMTDLICDETPSALGKALLDEKNGWDPYLEDNASLWLIHWLLMSNPDIMTAGNILFSQIHKPEFSKRDLIEIIAIIQEQLGQKPASSNIINRDIDCYLRLYAKPKGIEAKKTDPSFECPLQDLGLIHPMIDAEMYRFNIGPKPSLPPEIIGYAVWDYLRRRNNRPSMRLQECLYQEFSPGQVFMLDENTLIEAINTLGQSSEFSDDFSFIESAGIALISCTLSRGENLLKAYYTQGTSHA